MNIVIVWLVIVWSDTHTWVTEVVAFGTLSQAENFVATHDNCTLDDIHEVYAEGVEL